MHPIEVDLETLRAKLASHFGDLPPRGYVRGKTTLRNAVVDLLKCSALEAEQLVDTLESRRLIQYEGGPQQEIDRLEKHWQLEA